MRYVRPQKPRGSPLASRAAVISGRPPPYRSRSLDTGLDSEETPSTTSHLDVVASCENYLKEASEDVPSRRRLSSIPCEVVAEEEDHDKGSFVDKCMSKVRTLIRK